MDEYQRVVDACRELNLSQKCQILAPFVSLPS